MKIILCLFGRITILLYICIVNQSEFKMNWNEMKKKAIENGFVFLKHGSNHDIYEKKETGSRILLERHWTQEVRPGLMKKLKKEIGF